MIATTQGIVSTFCSTLWFIASRYIEVGKTSILNRLVHNSFTFQTKTTLNVELEDKIFDFESGTIVLKIWDTVILLLIKGWTGTFSIIGEFLSS